MITRSIDGSGNNLADPTENQAGSDFTRIGPANYADGVDALQSGPNPRTISNVVVGDGDAGVDNPEGLSAMMYAWGQFVDHDLDLANGDGTTAIDITIPADDTTFVPGSTIPLTRVVIDPATGKNGVAAKAIDSVTGWLDGSQVYGSDAATAASLRLADGHMKTSDGNNLPIVDGNFAAGDTRAQENPSITALQTLFVREHNRQVDLLKAAHPDWTGDQLYNQARAIVGAEIANITYSEFLPHLLGTDAIKTYTGYDSTVDAHITNEFAGAAYRFGHSIVSAKVVKLDELGAVVGPEQALREVFFEPTSDFEANGGADATLRHLGSDVSQALDVRIVDDLRNFLFAPPDGIDLAAINIQRGRDLGLGTLNQTRIALGLPAYTSFDQITSDTTAAADLQTAYGSVDAVDLWTGGLAENHVQGAFVGETFRAIIARQFTALRDGDRLWWQNQGFDATTAASIQSTTLSDLILLNTDTKAIQPDAFVFYARHSGALGGVASTDPESPQFIVGTEGADTLTGGPANDILLPAAGTPVLTGGGGADVFRFTATGTTATITDFTPGSDKIELALPSLEGAGELAIRQDGADTVITAGGDTIRLQGMTTLSPTDLRVTATGSLFNAAYYLAHNPDVADAGVDPYTHYMTIGWHEGRNPSSLFDTTWYLAHNPDVAAAGVNPLQHFETFGWREGRDPSASFSVADYLAANPDVAAANVDPLVHYVQFGESEGRMSFASDHAAGVDPAFYTAHTTLPQGVTASADYLGHGWAAGMNPNAWFDSAYYLKQNPDVKAAGMDPLLHYETYGWKEGRAPSLVFDGNAYLTANADVAAAGVDPLLHWLDFGKAEGRMTFLTGGTATADPLVDAAFYDRQLGATILPGGTAAATQAAWSYDSTGWQAGLNPDTWFDTTYYLAHNPDVAAAHINPLQHYETFGWKEGRDPSAAFSTTKYLAAYGDVKAAGVDPLLHFVTNGQAEGRTAFAV